MSYTPILLPNLPQISLASLIERRFRSLPNVRSYCNPTLATIGSLTEEGSATQAQYANDPRVKPLLDATQVENLQRCLCMAKDKGQVEYAYESVRQLHKAGIDIVAGSDSARPALGTAYGLSIHHEMALLVKKCGFSPLEALKAGTTEPARRLRFQDRGRIAEGLKADLFLVEGNPLDDIDRTLDLRGVWRDGVLCSTYEL